jgi:hypothetical protein
MYKNNPKILILFLLILLSENKNNTNKKRTTSAASEPQNEINTYYPCCDENFTLMAGNYKWAFKPVKESARNAATMELGRRTMLSDPSLALQQDTEFRNVQNLLESFNLATSLKYTMDTFTANNYLFIIPKYQIRSFPTKVAKIQRNFLEEMSLAKFMSIPLQPNELGIGPEMIGHAPVLMFGRGDQQYPANGIYFSVMERCTPIVYNDQMIYHSVLGPDSEFDKLINKLLTKNYVYLDIKPANLVLSPYDNKTLLFIDFDTNFCFPIGIDLNNPQNSEIREFFFHIHRFMYLYQLFKFWPEFERSQIINVLRTEYLEAENIFDEIGNIEELASSTNNIGKFIRVVKKLMGWYSQAYKPWKQAFKDLYLRFATLTRNEVTEIGFRLPKLATSTDPGVTQQQLEEADIVRAVLDIPPDQSLDRTFIDINEISNIFDSYSPFFVEDIPHPHYFRRLNIPTTVDYITKEIEESENPSSLNLPELPNIGAAELPDIEWEIGNSFTNDGMDLIDSVVAPNLAHQF